MTAAGRHVLITGASRGIGAALARVYAAPGVRLSLAGRDSGALEGVAAAARSAGAEVTAAVLDVRDAAAVAEWIDAADAERPLDLAVANAGVNRPDDPFGAAPDNLRLVLETNVLGAAHVVTACVPKMTARGRGQLGLMSSLAGITGFGGMASYGASKAAIRAYGQALRGELGRRGVKVSVICPGFVDTEMAAQVQGTRMGEWSAERAARFIAKGLAKNRGLIAFPPLEALGVRLLTVLPGVLMDPIGRGFRYRVDERG
ncbi:MAG: SDR family NAD(P)-dependent oxidoreductase [Alphaproteobacteria bacterium]|jgi:NADP-dependent 3-hydroxy acid dehydrogenase YdfG|nr:SDR family NAD(P)-dependent oxidoreductase [Alphaproteobacteria bacterium]